MKKSIFILFTLFFRFAMDAPAVDDRFLAKEKEEKADQSELFQAFKSGNYTQVISFFDTESRMQWQFPSSETSLKSCASLFLQQLVEALLEDFDSLSFKIEGNFLYVVYQEKIYTFSTLLKQANFRHLHFTEEKLACYHDLLQTNRLMKKPYVDFLDRYPTEEDFALMGANSPGNSLTLSEKEAINVYTGTLYLLMNAFLRGDLKKMLDSFSGFSEEEVNHWMKEIFLHCAIAISGLHKLPDYSVGSPEQLYLYRAEKEIPLSELKKRCWAVMCGGGITMEMGLISAAYQRPAEEYLNEDTQIVILIENLMGKDVTAFSRRGNHEREVVLPPTQLQWLYETTITLDQGQNTIQLFIARPVAVDSDYTID